MLDAAVAGLLTGLSLIVAIGAQNAFVLRQGLTREHVGPVVAVCAVSDLVLIAAGVGGVGSLVEQAPTLLTVVRWLGVSFLTAYAVRSLWHARHVEALPASSDGALDAARPTGALSGVLARAFALTWLNPHVYLDTVLLLGSVAAHHGPSGRWWFAAGAGLASVVWFTSLGYGARLVSPVLSRPRAWQVLDVLIAITMLAIAGQLALG